MIPALSLSYEIIIDPCNHSWWMDGMYEWLLIIYALYFHVAQYSNALNLTIKYIRI